MHNRDERISPIHFDCEDCCDIDEEHEGEPFQHMCVTAIGNEDFSQRATNTEEERVERRRPANHKCYRRAHRGKISRNIDRVRNHDEGDERKNDPFRIKHARIRDYAFSCHAADARRNKMLGLWAAEKLGKSGADAQAYADSLVAVEVSANATEKVLAKVLADFTAAGVAQSEHQIRRTMDQMLVTATAEIKDGKFNVWTGPMSDNTGKEVLAKDAKGDDKFVSGIMFFVKGVEGKVPSNK